MTSDPGRPDTILLIHGLYLTPASWQGWIDRFNARGFKTLAPSWPGLEGSVEELRRNPEPIAAQDVSKILDHYERLIRALDKPPIIMGHSFGGAFTQILVSRGLGAAAVAVDSAPVRGVYRLPFTTLKSNWPLLANPIARRKAVALTEKQFHYGFTSTLSEAEARPFYEKYAIPGSRNVLFTGANANLNPGSVLKVDFKKNDRAPLLLIGGGSDHVVPAVVNRENYGKYAHSTAITAYREFPGRPHFTAAVPGWEEVADYALDWALNPRAGVA